MRTTRTLLYGGLPDRDPLNRPPERSPPPLARDPPGQRPPWTETPPTETPPPVNRITDRCKNITLPQGGNGW